MRTIDLPNYLYMKLNCINQYMSVDSLLIIQSNANVINETFHIEIVTCYETEAGRGDQHIGARAKNMNAQGQKIFGHSIFVPWQSVFE